MTAANQHRIAIGVVTYQRPIGLRRTLDGIADMDLAGLGTEISIVVVDNDPDLSARVVVDGFRAASHLEVTYQAEPRRGIPFARNTAVQAAGAVDFIAWIDDDEVPVPTWLRHILDAERRFGGDVLIGPSEPRFPPGTPKWVGAAGVFERRRFATGSTIPANYARTSGVLIRRSSLPQRDAVFREDLRFTGGSDRALFLEMEGAGARFVWVDEAVVLELVPESRTRPRWIFQRAYRIGVSKSTTSTDRAGVRVRAARVAVGSRKIVLGLLVAMLGWRHGRAAAARGLWQCFHGAGLVAGALGLRYHEYRRHHGI
ncbi:MAG: succinoglycan biosynthesis protein ExoM [Actinomycetota bacterium]|jgi:glycosyltransferase involved in cell wall biosynthesis|nr:succinoglycan biosynthesis protein ExoM [Actinomycetota bacterium]